MLLHAIYYHTFMDLRSLAPTSTGSVKRAASIHGMVPLALLCAVLFGTSGCGAQSVSGGSSDEGSTKTKVTISRVTDGDTVKISRDIDGANSVRFIGVDAPEISHGQGAAQPLGLEAAAFTKKNLLNQDVSLEFDAEKKDKYGRLLAYVYLPDGTMFDEMLLKEGYAQVATFPPNTRGDPRVDYKRCCESRHESHHRGCFVLVQPRCAKPRSYFRSAKTLQREDAALKVS